MKNSILEPAENFNSKPALNFISNRVHERAKNTARDSAINSAPALNSAQIPNCVENKALNSAKAYKTDPCENSARNFKRNFILNCAENFTRNGANSASSLSRASIVDEPNLSPAKSLAAAHTRRSKKNFTEVIASGHGSTHTPQSFNYGAARNPGTPQKI